MPAQAATAPTLRARMQQVREQAVVDVANRLLAEKGYDQMTVDEVAAAVGMAKASLYKVFPSKEALAAAAMVRVLDHALALVASLHANASLDALGRLREVVRWALLMLYDGNMPTLPAQNSALRTVLAGHRVYLDRLMRLSDDLGAWVEQAQAQGSISAALPPELVLFTLYGKACDPVLGVMKATQRYGREALVELLLSTCFLGLASAPAAGPASAPRKKKLA